MHIDRNNYEEFFLLYADQELNPAERAALEAFVLLHPDLKAELDKILQTVLQQEAAMVFSDKESLFRTTETTLVNITNYEAFFVRYADDELNNEEKAATELFVYKHPEFEEDFELIQRARLSADTSIQFPDKSILYKTSDRKKPVVQLWMRYAAAAMLLLMAGIFWLQQRETKPSISATPVAVLQPEQPVIQPLKQPVQAVQPAADATTNANALVQPKKIKRDKISLPVFTPAEKPASREILAVQQPVVLPVQTDIAVTVPAVPVVVDAGRVLVAEAPKEVYASNAASEDFVYVNNAAGSRKSPFRGLLRKASRFVEQKNPLSPDHKKGGVFTASQD
jgi:tellurite resistance protein